MENQNDLQFLLDKDRIREVLARYCREVDRVNLSAAREVYFPEATEDHGVYRGTGWGFIDCPGSNDSAKQIVHHCLGQSMIDLRENIAFCETYFIAGMIFRPKEASAYFADVRGRYLDKMEKREGEWRIAQRVAVIDITEQRDVGKPWEVANLFIQGARWPDDMVYHFEELAKRVPRRQPPD